MANLPFDENNQKPGFNLGNIGQWIGVVMGAIGLMRLFKATTSKPAAMGVAQGGNATTQTPEQSQAVEIAKQALLAAQPNATNPSVMKVIAVPSSPTTFEVMFNSGTPGKLWYAIVDISTGAVTTSNFQS